MEEIYKERTKLRSFRNLKNVNKVFNLSTAPNDAIDEVNKKEQEKEETGKVSEIIAKKTGLSPRTYERAKKIIEEGTEEIKEKLRNNKTTIFKEYQKIQRDRKRLELLFQLSNVQLQNNKNNFENSNYKLIYGDFVEQSQKEIPDNSIDLIFTDPPYGQEYLQLYQELAKLSLRILKPGGSLVFYVGHIILDQVEIFKDFSLTDNNSSNLKYWWTFAVKHAGHHTKIHPRYVFAEWKPLLWYVKGERANDLVISNTIGDYIESTPPPKIEHDWQQSTVEAEYIIKNLTLENQTVLDPMMGTGTTGVATLNLKRKFIEIEKNLETFEIAKVRISQQERIKVTTNFFYSGHEKKNYNRFGYRRSWSFGKDYGSFNNTDYDECHDVYDRSELCYVTTVTEYDNPDNLTWTVKLCCGCLNVIIYDQDERIFKRKKHQI